MPALIGNRSHAMAAVDYVRSLKGEDCVAPTPTDDFRKVGSGAFRTAVLHIASSVIYKVEHGYKGSVAGYDNACEVRNARKLRRMSYPDGYWSTRVRIPKVSAFNVYDMLVVAMEFIDGTLGYNADDLVSEDAYAELRWLGFSDMHGNNYMVENDGTLVPIDLASGRYKVEYLWPEEIEQQRQKEQTCPRWLRQARERRRQQQAADREQVQRKAKGYCVCGCGLKMDGEVPLATWERELLGE